MKNLTHKIAVRLTLYFAAVLLGFSCIIGLVFMLLFQRHTVELHRTELTKQAVAIADNLNGLINIETDSKGGHRRGNHGDRHEEYGMVLQFLNAIAMTDVWIVDRNLELITPEHVNYQYKDLPANAEAVIERVFQGEVAYGEEFSDVLDAQTITVGAPMRTASGQIVGAVLLHSPVSGISAALDNGFRMLVLSIGVALLLGGVFAVLLSRRFTRPLAQMRDTALRLSDGDYTVKTGVSQEDEIGALALTMDQLADRLEEASKAREKLDQLRKDFTANISHELRTPVTVIRGSLEALCDGIISQPDQVEEYHRQMLQESIALQRLVNDLLELTRLQNADFPMELAAFSLEDVLGDAARAGQRLAAQKDVRLQKISDGSSCMFHGDYSRLRQMLLTVVDNGIKFTPPGQTVTMERAGRTITVTDQGCGIKAADLPYLFDRFYHVKSQKNQNGTGLGLAIAKQIADRHGIEIMVESEEGTGTSFRFIFPDDRPDRHGHRFL